MLLVSQLSSSLGFGQSLMDCQAAKSSVSPLQLHDSYLAYFQQIGHFYRLQVSLLMKLERSSIDTFVIKVLLVVMVECPY